MTDDVPSRHTCPTPRCSQPVAYRGLCRTCYLRKTYSSLRLLEPDPFGPGTPGSWEPLDLKDESLEAEIVKLISKISN
jgi:hypothetical protein